MLLEGLGALLLWLGAGFYLAGTVALLRFPDVYTRLHALTKADNLGLGLVVLGLMLRAESGLIALKLLLIWPLVLMASATVSQVMAQRAHALGLRPWRKEGAS